MSSIFDTLYNQQPQQPRASMFDAANQAIAAIPQGRPAAPAAKKPGLLDYIWGVAAGYNPNDVGRMFDARERATALQESKLQAQQELSGLFSGEPQMPAMHGPQAPGAPAMGSVPAGLQRRGLPTLEAAAPVLARAQLAGIEGVGGVRELLMGLRPDIAIGPDGTPYNKNDPNVLSQRFANRTAINGTITDLNNPANEGRYLPQVGEGQEIVYDANNRPMVRDLPGYRDSRASLEGAIAGARQSAENPYTLTTVTGPNGQPITTSVANILQYGAVQGQSEAERTRAIDTAKQDVAREGDALTAGEGAQNALRTYDAMEAVLDDVISGFGANQRLGAARALAALGNEKAIREVTATQVFQNQGKQLVMDIIKSFGANPSNAEREYAEKMQGADVTLTPEALREGIRLGRESADRRIARADQVRASRGGPAALPSREALLAEARRRGLIR